MSPHPVLVVDDDRLMRESLCEMLDELSCRAEGVGDGTSAVDALRRGRFDLVFSDVDMPDFSGFELLNRIQRQFAERPGFVLMSARSGSELPAAATAAGALGFFHKPVEMRPLSDFVHTLWPAS